MTFPFTNQSDHEVWLVLDGRRSLARLRAAGPSWMHVFVEGEQPECSSVAFTFVLRGVGGGVIDGLSHVMSSVERDGRRVLHLRIIELSTGASPTLLERFAQDVLNDAPSNPLVAHAKGKSGRREAKLLGARHEDYRRVPSLVESSALADSLVVSKSVLWRLGNTTCDAHLVRSSLSGRRLLIRLEGPLPLAWEGVKIELDVGGMGEPRPIQLVAMVLGTVPTNEPGVHHVVVRLLRWSRDSDRVVWLRWLAHQQRLDTTMSPLDEVGLTRTIHPIRPSLPST